MLLTSFITKVIDTIVEASEGDLRKVSSSVNTLQFGIIFDFFIFDNIAYVIML